MYVYIYIYMYKLMIMRAQLINMRAALYIIAALQLYAASLNFHAIFSGQLLYIKRLSAAAHCTSRHNIQN